MNDLQTRIESLSPARRKLLERMSAKKQQQLRTYPLSYAQRRMWFTDQLEPGSALYNMPFAIRLTGKLDTEIVQRAAQEIVDRHESLRTIFPQRNGVAVQEVLVDLKCPIEFVDLTRLAEIQREDEVKKLVRQEAFRPFNLAQGPLFRVVLYQLGEREHIILFNMHHIVSDGWSIGVFEQEFEKLYKAFSAGKPSSLPQLELQYGDFAVWQRGWLNSGAMQQQLEYWKKQLAGVADVVLPTDYSRPPMLTHQGRTLEFPFPTELSTRIKEFCRREGVTLFMALLAGLELAIARYMGARGFAVGTPIANRNRLETEKLIGCFINTLVLRSDLQGHVTFRELVTRVRETTLGAYEHQDMPFEKLVEELVPAQSLSRTPLFQVLFVLQNFPSADCDLPGLTRSNVDTGLNMAKVEMTVTVVEHGGALFGSLQYDADLFERARMQRVMEHFYLVLERMVSHPEQNIWASSLLPKVERDRVLDEWNQTEADYPRQKPLHAFFEEQVLRNPLTVAVQQGERQLTYAELNQRANQLARYLQRMGVGSETTVGVCMERSLDMFVALLGIMKAGGVYVPLDPGYPVDRLTFMAEDAALKLTLLHDSTADIASPLAAHSVNLIRDSELISHEPESNLPLNNHPEDLVYIIYTSGSTGNPKGVGISHRAACNQLCWATRAFQLSAADRFLQKASVSFDSSIEEIFTPLLAGARIIAAKPHGEHDVEYLAELVADQGVTCIDLPPSLLQAFLDYPNAQVWNSVRLVISGGEALKPELVKLFSTKFSGTLLNTYGPTEATVQCAWAEGLQPGGSIPIGRPVANTRLYVLDENLEPVPVGAPGELFIAGVGLARGYIRRPELTAEKFVPDPFTASGGERLYRTGDLVKWRNDGQLDFIGRRDHQVKLRGYRIELGEIENAIEAHPQVKQAIVIVREDQSGAQRLVAYVMKLAEGPILNAAGLREYLKDRLPEYMMPAAWVEMKEFPLTPNGKIDRKALPEPGMQLVTGEYVRPRNATEEILAGLWESVLKQDQVSVEANFFDLGGHSLLAMQLISRIRKAFSVDLPLRMLFESPTVAAMAQHIGRELQVQSAIEMPRIAKVQRGGSLPLSFAQQRLWFLDQLVPGSTAYNISLAFRLTGRLDLEALRRSWQEIVHRHEALRTLFAEEDGVPVQVIESAVGWQIEEADLRLSHVSQADVRRLAQAEAQKPFDLSVGPLFRVKLLQVETHDHVLAITVHHIVSDGWSIGTMLREFTQIYTAFAAGERAPLADLEFQYADYAVWQREWLQGELLERQLAYWRKQLAAVEPLDLPTRHSLPEIKSAVESSIGWKLPEQLSLELRELSRRQGTTLFMTLLAAFQALLSRYSAQQSITVGTPVAGRRWEETHPIIGFFVNTLVLRTDLSGEPGFEELLKRVRETTLEAYAHQDVTFEKLVEELQPDRDLTRQPFFQVVFALQHDEEGDFDLPGLKVTGLDIEDTRTAKFDLMLGVQAGNRSIRGSFDYSTDLFDPLMMETMVRHWQMLLEEVVKDPGKPVIQVSLLPPEERQLPAVEEITTQNFATLMAANTARQPQATALAGNFGQLSYAELNSRANQWAHFLIREGVQPGTRIAVCLQDPFERIVTSLGILKSGAVLAGLEPGGPSARLQRIFDSSSASLLISMPEFSDCISLGAAKLISFPDQQAKVTAESCSNPEINIDGEGPAYLLYRFNAAGQPVGVLLPHRALCAGTSSQVSESGRIAQICDFSREATSIEMFRTLARGACIVALPGHLPLPPRKLASLLVEQKVTTLWTSAAVLESIAKEFPWTLKNVRQIFCDDHENVLATLRGKLKADLLQRIYGVHAFAETGGCWKASPLGSALPTTLDPQHLTPGIQIHLLENGREAAAAGVLAEIYITGGRLALGHDPRDGAFMPGPFAAPAQMYRSGEWARRHPNGELEYRGRRDRQMIVAGQRIHAEEIEAALMQHEDVRQAAAVMGPAGELAALVVSAEGQAVSPEQLRSFLLHSLPEPLMPTVILQVEEIVFTAQGKISYEQKNYVAPRNDQEEQITQIWRELLQVGEVGVHDDFFKLGGHSLLAVRLKALLQDRLNWEMPLVELFKSPTIAGLAKLMAQAPQLQRSSDLSSSILVEVQPGASRTPLFLVHPVGGSVLCYVDLARELGPEQPVYALQSPAVVPDTHDLATIEQMADAYINTLRSVQPAGPYHLGGWSMGGLVAWEIARQLIAQGESVAGLALIDTYPPTTETARDVQSPSMLSSFAQDIAYMVGENIQEQETAFLGADHEQQWTMLKELLLRHGLVSRHKADEETNNLLAIFTRNARAMESYSASPLDLRVSFFAAAESHMSAQLAAEWGQRARGGVDLHVVAGNHYSMIRRPNVATIAMALGHLSKDVESNAVFAGVL